MCTDCLFFDCDYQIDTDSWFIFVSTRCIHFCTVLSSGHVCLKHCLLHSFYNCCICVCIVDKASFCCFRCLFLSSFLFHFIRPNVHLLLLPVNKRTQCAECAFQLLFLEIQSEAKNITLQNFSLSPLSVTDIEFPHCKHSDSKSMSLRQGVTLKHCIEACGCAGNLSLAAVNGRHSGIICTADSRQLLIVRNCSI